MEVFIFLKSTWYYNCKHHNLPNKKTSPIVSSLKTALDKNLERFEILRINRK